MKKNEINHQFRNSQPKFVFSDASAYEKVSNVSKSISSIQKIYTVGESKDCESYATLISGEDGSAFPRNVQIDPREDVLFLPYSSGTTGLSKGVMLTHYNFVSLLTISKVKPLYLSDCRYSVLPLFHIFGLMVAFRALDQGTRHVLDVRFRLRNVFSCIEKYQVTQFSGVPPMLLMMANSELVNDFDLTSLRFIHSGAAPLPSTIADLIRKRLGCGIDQGWGMTEAVAVVTPAAEVIPIESVGRVIDINTGKELGPNKKGEICVKGPQVMKGYFKNQEATRNTIDVEGWLHSGDIGYYDENEFIYIVDRLKELIKYKGFQVAPAELEAILLSNPRIADAAVVGIPDVDAGEIAKAFVVKKDESLTKQEVHDFVAGRVSRYKYLHGGVEFETEIKKTASGKILRRSYRQKATSKAKL